MLYEEQYGHIQRNCREREKSQNADKTKYTAKHKINSTHTRQPVVTTSSDSDKVGMVVNHILSANEMTQLTGKWIVDSGAASHICNDRNLFVKLDPLKIPISVTLGDGRVLKATARGIVSLKMTYDCGTRKCKLHDVLHVPDLSYNLLSVSKAVEKGITVKFDKSIPDTNRKIITVAAKAGGLYHINTAPVEAHSMTAHHGSFSREDLWHRRYGHLSVKSLKKLA